MSLVLNFFFIFLLLIFTNISSATNNVITDKCNWDNKLITPCIEIIKKIPNSSEFTKNGIKKIIISKKQIDEVGAVDLIDVLKLVPDINITQSGPKGQQASNFMRGTGSNHTLVMINGVAINDQSALQGLHDFGVDFIQTVQQIEVYPGSNAAHFGANAIGGAINIILTGDYKDNISFLSDKNNNYEFTANKTFVNDNSSLNIKFGNIKNETISVQGDKNDEKDGVENYTTNINYETFIKPNLRLFNTTYLRQTVAEYDNSATNQTGYEGNNNMGSIQFGLENLNEKKKEKYIFYYTLYDREYDERSIIDIYESEAIGLKYDFSKTLNKKISLGAGSEYKYDWGYFNNNGSYSSSTKGNIDNIAIYSNFGFNFLENTNLSLFIRSDTHKQIGNNYTYKLYLGRKIGKFKLGLSRMTGLRTPTLYELFGSSSSGYSGNKGLKAEKSLTNEIYFDYFFNKNLSLSTTLFRSNIYDNIEYLNSSKKYVNDDDDVNLNQSGINGNISLKHKNTNFNFFASFLSSKKENSSDQTRRPEKTYGLNLSKLIKNKHFGNLNLNASYKHYGKHFDVQNVSPWSTVQVDSTDLVDLRIVKDINNIDFFIKMSNLFDESYQRPLGYNQNGRSFNVGIKKSY